jgi:hypothetical protein
MVKHIVMWSLRGDTREERQRAAVFLKGRFEQLCGQVPGLRHLEIGMDTSGADYACDVVLYSEFDSQAALDAYATDPAHLRVKDEVGGLRLERHQVDYTPGQP